MQNSSLPVAISASANADSTSFAPPQSGSPYSPLQPTTPPKPHHPPPAPPILPRHPDQRPEAAPAPRALGEGCLQVEVAADLDLAYIRVCGRVLCGHGCRPVDARAMDDQVNSATLFDPLGDSAKLGRVANIGAVVSRPAAAVVGFELGYEFLRLDRPGDRLE